LAAVGAIDVVGVVDGVTVAGAGAAAAALESVVGVCSSDTATV